MKRSLFSILLCLSFALLISLSPYEITKSSDLDLAGTDAGDEPHVLSPDEVETLPLVQARIVPGDPTLLKAEARALIEKELLSGHQRPAPLSLQDLGGNIAFGSDRPLAGVPAAIFNLYTQVVGSSQAEIITSSQGNDVTPVWSPDGTQLLFASDRDGDFDIYLRTAAGVEQQLTHNTSQDIHPSWTPDGGHIIFSSNKSGYYQIYTMAPDGDGVEQVGSVSGNNAVYPRYAPDGRRISFMRASITIPACDWNWDIWVMDADGNNQQKLTTQLGGDLYPEWTPDGGEIVYAKCEYLFSSDLYARNPDTGAERQLTNRFLSNEWAVAYSPDGAYLAYNTDWDGNVEIYLQSLADSNLVPFNLTSNEADDLAASWIGQAGDGAIISGQIVTPEGYPISGASVANGVTANVTTDHDGRYRFSGLTGGSYTLTVQYGNYTFDPSQRVVTVPPNRFGENFVGKNCQQATAVNPIILITGWGGSETNNLVYDDQLRYFVDFSEHIGHLTPLGYVEGCNLFYLRGTSPRKTLDENAVVIRDQLCSFYDAVEITGFDWSGEFDILAHSYGGLRARRYLERADLYGVPCPGSTKEVRVRNLFTMGTPHGGEWGDLPFATFIGLASLLRGGEWPAIMEMLPPVRAWQNITSQQPDNLCYYSIGGDARWQWPVILTLLALGNYGDYVLSTANDLAVHQQSAHILGEWPYYPGYSNMAQITTLDLHGQVGSLLLESYVNPNQTFENQIWSTIVQNAECPTQVQAGNIVAAPANSSVLRLVEQQQEPYQATPVSLNDLAAGTIMSDHVATGQFVMETGGSTSVNLYWTTGEMELTLADPAGRPLTPQTVATDPSVDYVSLDTGLGMMATYRLSSALAGTWTYTITAASLVESAAYRLLLLPSLPVAVAGSTPVWLPSDSPVVITATISYSATLPIAGGSLTAEIQRPDMTSEIFALFDDGGHQDGEAGDGIFGATYEHTDLPGIYGVKLKAVGNYNGQAYERTGTTLFTISPPAVGLSNPYSDRAVTNNFFSGLNTSLEVSTELDLVKSGAYIISAELYAGDGFITKTAVRLELVAGPNTVKLSFDGNDIRRLQLDGPYTVRNVVLLDATETTLLVEAADFVHRTAAYSYEQFGTLYPLYLPFIGGRN